MAKRKQLTASEMARKRWEGTTLEERQEVGRRLSALAAAARTEKARLRREAEDSTDRSVA